MPDKPFHIALELLDRQLIDADELPCGKVDDLRLSWEKGARPVVTHILVGPGALGPRLHGPVGRTLFAVWRRLHPQQEPEPVALEWETIGKTDYAIHLKVRAKDGGLRRGQQWVYNRIIAKIPGVR